MVEPPKAACTTIAFRTAASVRMSRAAIPRAARATSARAERRAASTHTGWPEGASAAWGSARPSASPTTCEVAAVPRNWQPPPGEPHARQPSSAASSSVSSPWAKRAPIDWILPASSPSRGGSVTPPGTSTEGSSRSAASASIIAGSPLSHVATPSTPRRVGSERISRRKTCAASFRYARLSSMPTVPCVRPSHGSEQYPANGRHSSRSSSSAAACISRPTSQWPVW